MHELNGSALQIGGGVLGDCWQPHERGKAMAIFSLAPLMGPVIGPTTGAWLVDITISITPLFKSSTGSLNAQPGGGWYVTIPSSIVNFFHLSDSFGRRPLWMQLYKSSEYFFCKRVSKSSGFFRRFLLILFSLRASLVEEEGRTHSQIYGRRKSTLQGNSYRFRRSGSLVSSLYDSDKRL